MILSILFCEKAEKSDATPRELDWPGNIAFGHRTPLIRLQDMTHLQLLSHHQKDSPKSIETSSIMPPKKHSSTKATKSPKPPPNSPPNWPALKPLVPTSDLTLNTLLPSQIVTISQFFTSTLCKTYVNFLKELPLTTTPGKPKKGDALRFNDRFQVHDEAFANRLWLETGLKELVCGSEGEGDDGTAEGDRMTKEERRELWFVVPCPSLVLFFRG